MSDYESMARLARSLLEAGKSDEEILRACYGLSFPAEVFAFAELLADEREPNVDWASLPFDLLTPLERGGPPARSSGWDAPPLDSSLIAIMLLYGDHRHGNNILCYRRDELAAGRASVFGLPHKVPGVAVATRLGDSLGVVLREYFEDVVQAREWEASRDRTVGYDDVEHAQEQLLRVDDLIAMAAERVSGAKRVKPWVRRSLTDQLYAAAEQGDVPALRELLDQGAVLNPPEKLSALTGAILKSQLDAALFLLDAGAELDHRGPALNRACGNSTLEMVEFVLQRGASVKDWQVLSYVTSNPNKALVGPILGLLLKYGIDSNAHTYANSILMIACEYGDLETVRALLDAGADPNVRRNGTALTLAEQNGHEVIVDLLLERGAEPDRPAIPEDKEGDAIGKAALEQPHDAKRRMAWAEVLIRRGFRAAAAREAEVAKKLDPSSGSLRGLSFENPPGTTWEFTPFDAPTSEVTGQIEDSRFPGARVTSGTWTLPLAVVLGPVCTRCDERAEIDCSECRGTGYGDNWMTGGSFKCEPRQTCDECYGLSYVVRPRPFGKGRCKHAVMKAEVKLPPTHQGNFQHELTLNRCVECGLPALNKELACGLCGYLTCRCPPRLPR